MLKKLLTLLLHGHQLLDVNQMKIHLINLHVTIAMSTEDIIMMEQSEKILSHQLQLLPKLNGHLLLDVIQMKIHLINLHVIIAMSLEDTILMELLAKI